MLKTVLKAIGVILGSIIVLSLGLGGFYAWRTGAFRTFPPASDVCSAFALAGVSAEDIAVDRDRAVAYISALDRRGQAPTGTIQQIDLRQTPWTVTEAVTGAPANFRPHGISLFTSADGHQTLMAISHPIGEGHRVEVFDRAPDGQFVHVRSVAGPELFKPNDLAAVGPRQFYLVNDSGARSGVQRAAEQLFAAGYSALVYFDGEKLTEVLSDLASPGGVNVSTDGGRLFIAETQAKRVRILARDASSSALTEEARVPLAGLPDNIDIDANGAAWVASHGSAIGLVRQFIDPEKFSPSIVNRISRGAGGQWIAPEMRVSDGRELSAASVAVPQGGKLLMGSITDRKIMSCPLPN